MTSHRTAHRNDVTSNYETGVKWMLATLLVQCCYKVGTHASFYFRLIISQTIKLTQRNPYNEMI